MKAVLGREAPPLLGLVLAVALIFAAFYGCWAPADWSQPLFIKEDVPLLAGYLKASSEGDAWPLLPHLVTRLNAPFVANWADFPTTEELIYGYGGLLTRWLGVICAYNLCLLSAHLSAAVSFYAAARLSGSRAVWAVLGGVAFASSRFMFVRDRVHLNLTFCWHLPLFWVAACWLYEGRSLAGWRGPALLALCAVTGWQHPYYWYFWCALLVPCLARAAVRRDGPALRRLAAVGAATLGALLLAHVDTLVAGWRYGASHLAWERTLAELQLYGLRLPELLLPLDHRWSWLDRWSWLHYYKPMFGHAQEVDSSYQGVLGLVGLAWMLLRTGRRLRAGQALETAALLCGWIVLLAVNGGLHFLAGSLGLLLFRCSCRFSVLLLAGGLLYLCARLSELPWGPARRRLTCASLLVLTLWDTLPPPPDGDQRQATRAYLENQQAAVGYLEAHLPAQGMVFQWPVTGYPETPPLEKLAHYEELVGYLLSRTLRFSYGDCRGRPESQWQGELNDLEPRRLLDQVAGYGFGACWLYTRGLTPEARARWQAVAPDFVSPAGDLWIYRLHPAAAPALPPRLPCAAFDRAFYEPESQAGHTWRWVSGPAEISLLAPAGTATLDFSLSSYGRPRPVEVRLDGATVWSGSAGSGAEQATAVHLEVDLTAGNHRLSLQPGGSLPSRAEDGRLLVFCLHDWKLVPAKKSAAK